jgi:glycosyltransferase involved in cell wall biosynthesis
VKKRVAIVYRYIPQYRLDFYNRLYNLCKGTNITLDVIYGNPSPIDNKKRDSVDFLPGKFIENHWLSVGRIELAWQPVLSEIRSADLIVVEQANKLLINYLLILRQKLGLEKFAFWGHGKNYQATKHHRLSERLKRQLITLPHWWFAYTPGVARLIESSGFPAERITILYNSIDTKSLRETRDSISAAEIAAARLEIGLNSDNVCIYVGGMYPEKRLRFLLDSCVEIRQRVPNFQMIFIGAGLDDQLVQTFCSANPWAIYLGSKFGADKVKYILMSKLLLMPGLVGLAIIDAFTLEVPIVTTDINFHSPEIEYLVNGHNGMIVSPTDDPRHYAVVVAGLLTDSKSRGTLREGCRESASLYSIENMAGRFFDGLVKALE